MTTPEENGWVRLDDGWYKAVRNTVPIDMAISYLVPETPKPSPHPTQ